MEILQVVGEAHADMSGVCVETSIMDKSLGVNTTGVSAVEVDVTTTVESTDPKTEQQTDNKNDKAFKKAR